MKRLQEGDELDAELQPLQRFVGVVQSAWGLCATKYNREDNREILIAGILYVDTSS